MGDVCVKERRRRRRVTTVQTPQTVNNASGIKLLSICYHLFRVLYIYFIIMAMLTVIRQAVGMNSLAVCSPRIAAAGGISEKLASAATRSTCIALNAASGIGPLANSFHTSATLSNFHKPRGPQKFLKYNDVVYPPTPHGEKERPAFLCHLKENIKYSPKKMWYIACLVRGMKIDDAINQLKFVHKKGAVAARETLEEAQELAVKEHNVEFKSNLWVSESFVGKGMVIKGYRRHARKRFGVIEYKYCHYFVTLEEGEPPEHYYHYRKTLTPQELLEQWMGDLRKRTIQKTF